MLLGALDWTQIMVAIIAAFASIVNVLGVAFLIYYVKPPSGGTPGAMIEQTHAAAHANTALMTTLVKELNGGTDAKP